MNRKPRQAWELYLKMETSSESFSLLQVIANDCYKVRNAMHVYVMPFPSPILYCIVLCGVVWCGMVWCGVVLYCNKPTASKHATDASVYCHILIIVNIDN